MEGENSIITNEMYKECLKNHAANLGSYATDGCGEFTLDDIDGGLNCAACGCHRNFHRKAHHCGPHDVIGGGTGKQLTMAYSPEEQGSKKRFRTKFTEEQKEKMLGFAEKLGWKMQRKDGELDDIERFCRGAGVSRKVFKVWMHNHKLNFRSH